MFLVVEGIIIKGVIDDEVIEVIGFLKESLWVYFVDVFVMVIDDIIRRFCL